jgi:prepilin-type N-terminal cleavage/methylation domain-containing protein
MKKGFTLIEILIALVIMLVGLLGIITLFPLAIKNTGEAMKDTEVGFLANFIKASLENGMRAAPPGGPVTVKLVGLPRDQMKFPLPKYPTEEGGSSKYYMFPPTNKHYPPGGANIVAQPPVGEGENLEGTSSDKMVYNACPRDVTDSQVWERLKELGGEAKDLGKEGVAICNLSYAFDVQRPEPIPYYKFRIKIYSHYEEQIKRGIKGEDINPETFWILLASNGD